MSHPELLNSFRTNLFQQPRLHTRIQNLCVGPWRHEQRLVSRATQQKECLEERYYAKAGKELQLREERRGEEAGIMMG